jgi:two-component system chemotaxis response regulator CheY
MTTALDGFEDVRQAFRDQCDGYLVKPLDRKALFDLLRSLALVPAEA